MTKQIDSFQKSIALVVGLASIVGLFMAILVGVYKVGWTVRGQTATIQSVEAKTVVMQQSHIKLAREVEDESEKVWKRFELDKDDRFEISKAVEFLTRGIN